MSANHALLAARLDGHHYPATISAANPVCASCRVRATEDGLRHDVQPDDERRAREYLTVFEPLGNPAEL